jgi:hypothetical protein
MLQNIRSFGIGYLQQVYKTDGKECTQPNLDVWQDFGFPTVTIFQTIDDNYIGGYYVKDSTKSFLFSVTEG